MRGAPSSIQAIAPTKGGMKMGSCARCSSTAPPATLLRANSQPSGTPKPEAMTVAPSEIVSVLSSATQ